MGVYDRFFAGRLSFGLVVRLVSVAVVLLVSLFFLGALFSVGVTVTRFIKVLLLLALYAFLPGYLLSRLVVEKGKLSQLLAYCLVFSAAILIALYFVDTLAIARFVPGASAYLASVFSSMHLDAIAAGMGKGAFLELVGCPLISAFALFYAARDLKDGRLKFDRSQIDVRLLAIVAIASLVAFLSIFLRVSVPVNKIGYTSIYYDVAWLISNDAAVAGGWPADGFQYLGKHLNSNIFANVYRATLSRVSGISSAEIFGIYVPFVAIPSAIFSVHALAERCLKNINKATFATFAFTFVSYFSTAIIYLHDLDSASIAAAKSYFFSAMVNIFYCPNGIDLAIPATCVLLILVLKAWSEEKPPKSSYIAILFIAALCTGAKFVFTVCVLIVIVATCLILFLRHRDIRAISSHVCTAVAIGLALVLVYCNVVRGGQVYMAPTEARPVYQADSTVPSYESEGYAYSGDYSSLQAGSAVKKSILFSRTKSFFSLPDSMDGVLAAVLIPPHFVLQQVLVAIPFIIWFVSKLRNFESASEQDILVGGIAASGILIYYILSVDGLSQTYFFFVASIMINMMGANWVYDRLASRKLYWIIPVCACMAIGLASTFGISMAHRAVPGAEALRRASDASTWGEVKPGYDRITASEYEAMVWLKDNTPVDAVIAVDRHYSKRLPKHAVPEPNQPESRFYYYTEYSERQTFIGSWAYMPRTAEMQRQIVERLKANDALYRNDCLNRRSIMKKNGISYIVVSRFVNPNLRLTDPNLQLVFENADIKIYGLA